MKRLLISISIGVLAILSVPTAAAADAGISVTFSDAEVRIITAWYDDHAPKKHGKGKQGGLPPGIARNLARGKSLPPGIAKQHLPQELQRALPAAPAGFDRIIVDGKVLLVDAATQVIHDVLMDVVLD